jgi:hypothetical protein
MEKQVVDFGGYILGIVTKDKEAVDPRVINLTSENKGKSA